MSSSVGANELRLTIATSATYRNLIFSAEIPVTVPQSWLLQCW